MPGLGLDAAAAARVGPVEAKASHVDAEPRGKPGERAAAPVFGDLQLAAHILLAMTRPSATSMSVPQ